MKNLLLIFGTLFCLHVKSQDTIIVYDVATQDTSMILPVSFNVNITSDHSSFSYGSMGTRVVLPQTTPTANLFNGAGFTKRERAADFFNLAAFHVRTCVNLRQYLDTSQFISSGMIVGPCFVLISGSAVLPQQTKPSSNLNTSLLKNIL